MSVKLKSEYVRDVESMSAGTTIRFNHKDCPAGEDTRRRLYVTKPATGDEVLAYCHNCQMGGRWEIEGFRPDFSSDRVLTTELVKPGEWKYPVVSNTPEEWPADMRAWFYSHGISVPLLELMGVGYSAQHHGVFLPMYNEVIFSVDKPPLLLDIKGYQIRDLQGAGPKYITAMKDREAQMYSILMMASPKEDRVGVVVEDLLSGIRIIQAAMTEELPVNVLVNYGTKVDPHVLGQLDADRFTVWLDNDNDHVILQAETIGRTLQVINRKPVHVHKEKIDPKAESYENIKEVLWT